MFTDDQLNQLRNVIREEIETEAEKTRNELSDLSLEVTTRFDDVEDSIKDLKISTRLLEKSQDEIKTEQKAQSKKINSIKRTVTKTGKTIEEVVGHFDKRIVLESKRVDRIEDILKLPPFKN